MILMGHYDHVLDHKKQEKEGMSRAELSLWRACGWGG